MSWPWWLRLSIPLGIVGMVAAAIGIFVPDAYTGMTENWADQTFAQDIADLLVGFPLLLAFAWLAARGSERARLAWLGVLVATAYTYVIYAFAVPFGPMYLVNVVLLGLAGWALLGAARAIDPDAIRARFDDATPTRSTGIALVVIGVLFLGMWLAEDVPAMLTGETPATLEEVGLIVNPVHVLDTAFLLPASIVTGGALLRRRAFAFAVAPALLVTFAVLSAGIFTILLVAWRGGDDAALPVALGIAAIGVLQAVLAIRFLRHLGPHRA